MKVFASNYLEKPTEQKTIDPEHWSWKPTTPLINKIYASGAPTSTQQSTYANDRDKMSDSDRPNEGGHAA